MYKRQGTHQQKCGRQTDTVRNEQDSAEHQPVQKRKQQKGDEPPAQRAFQAQNPLIIERLIGCLLYTSGLLHDLFLYDWHFHAKETGNYFHGLTHPRRALENAQRLFSLTDREKNIILRHMWPLTITPPKYREAYVLSLIHIWPFSARPLL